MDFLKISKNLNLRKYRAVLIVILAGFLLMMLPEKQERPISVPEVPAAVDFQEQLRQLLSSIQGAGRVELLLSEEAGPLTVYQNDEDRDEGGFRRNTVVLTGSDRQQQGLVRQISAPRYRGAVVIAQGADSSAVRLAIVRAVSSAAGLSSDKITVLKMK